MKASIAGAAIERQASDTDALQEEAPGVLDKRRYNDAAPETSRSGAAGVIAPKLLRPWRWRFFWLSLVSTFRLPVALAVIG